MEFFYFTPTQPLLVSLLGHSEHRAHAQWVNVGTEERQCLMLKIVHPGKPAIEARLTRIPGYWGASESNPEGIAWQVSRPRPEVPASWLLVSPSSIYSIEPLEELPTEPFRCKNVGRSGYGSLQEHHIKYLDDCDVLIDGLLWTDALEAMIDEADDMQAQRMDENLRAARRITEGLRERRAAVGDGDMDDPFAE